MSSSSSSAQQHFVALAFGGGVVSWSWHLFYRHFTGIFHKLQFIVV